MSGEKMKHSVFTAFVLGAMMVIAGCQESQFNLVYQQGQTSTYKVTQDTIKEVSFEQPTAGKSKLDKNVGHVEMVFAQTPLNIEENGDVVLGIVVKELVFLSKSAKGVNIDFDSKRDKNAQLSGVIGGEYSIKVTPAGIVSVVDSSDIRSKCRTPEAKALFNDENIVVRHTIEGVPSSQTEVAKGKSWVKYGTTPKGALQAKSFEKVYTVDGIDDGVASITMTADETSKEIEGFDAGSGSLGFMANIFDSSFTYSGSMKYDMVNGVIDSFNETLVTEHIAAEQPKNVSEGEDKGPDVLTMRFTSTHSLEKL